MENKVNSLLQREMSRQEFIAFVALGLVSLAGVGTILKNLLGVLDKKQPASAPGYGFSPYGGTKE